MESERTVYRRNISYSCSKLRLLSSYLPLPDGCREHTRRSRNVTRPSPSIRPSVHLSISSRSSSHRRTATMIITRAISLTNFAVASSALAFQVFVLYPWHQQLDDSFEKLKKEHVRVLDAVHEVANQVDPDSRKGIRDTILERLGKTTAFSRT